MHDLHSICKQLNSLEMFLAQLDTKCVQKEEILLSPKETVKAAFFVKKGLVRAYYKEEVDRKGAYREVSPWIVPAPGFLTDVPGFLLNMPSSLYIEALEDSEICILTQVQYRSLSSQFSELVSYLFNKTLIKADQRVRMLYLKRPEHRLEAMDKMYPGLQNRLSVNITASFINVDPSTLSRIRAKRL